MDESFRAAATEESYQGSVELSNAVPNEVYESHTALALGENYQGRPLLYYNNVKQYSRE